jgi:hypothetical protein
MTWDPFLQPELGDLFTLDTLEHPGISWVDSDGKRTEEFLDQQVPLTRGATTIFKFEPNGSITYSIGMWTSQQILLWAQFVAMLNEGKNRTPRPRVYVLGDVRLEDVRIAQVSFQELGPRAVKRGSKMVCTLKLKEVRRQKPYGGAALPKDDPGLAAKLAALRGQTKDLGGTLERAAATRAAGRAAKAGGSAP